MIEARQAFIFISIPRCASSTVHKLFGLPGPKDFSKASDPGILDNHAPWEMVHRRYGAEEFSRRFKFCFVRNPWDRAVSWYEHHVKGAPYARYTFREWIAAGMPHHWDIQNGTIYQSRRTPLEQYRFITDSSGRQVVDFVGRIENFDDDFRRAAETIGVTLPPEIPRINNAKTRSSQDYRSYYDDRAAEQLGNLLATDVRTFGYTF